MATSGKTSKSAAPSTPAAQPADSQSAAESDALPSRGAVRGDMLGIKAALGAELGQLSDVQNDETGGDGSEADSEESSNLGQFDEQQAAEAEGESGEGEGEGEGSTDEAEGADDAEGAEGEAESDEAESEDAPESEQPPAAEGEGEKPKHPELQARINELTARAKGAEEQLAAANERLAAYRARDDGRLTPDVLDHVETPEDLAGAQQRYSALLQWAIRNPDGGKLGEREYDAEQVRELHAEVQTLMTEAIPARREFLANRSKADAAAISFYPWLKDTGKGAAAMVHKAIEEIPAIRRLPNYRMLAADAFVGQVLRSNGVSMTDSLLSKIVALVKTEQSQQGKGKTAAAKPQGQAQRKGPAARPPAAPARAGALPPRQTPRAAAAKAAGQRLRTSTGSEDDLAASIANKL